MALSERDEFLEIEVFEREAFFVTLLLGRNNIPLTKPANLVTNHFIHASGIVEFRNKK